MLCEETFGFSKHPEQNGSLLNCEELHTRGHRTALPDRTLYASLWHCLACERNVRVYSRLAEVISGSTRKDCPACGSRMEAGSAPEPDPHTDFSTRSIKDRLKPVSAWAA